MNNYVSVFWFRRDLRLSDNVALYHAINSGNKVLPIFIFDDEILEILQKNDYRVSFIYDLLEKIDKKLKNKKSALLIKKGNPLDVFKKLIADFPVKKVYLNKDYEPYAIKRDKDIKDFLKLKNIDFLSFKDQVIFEQNEVVKNDGTPYTVFTPFKNKWIKQFESERDTKEFKINFHHFYKFSACFPSLKSIGFTKSSVRVKPYDLSKIKNYNITRNFPSENSTTYLSVHLRFGTISIRKVVKLAFQSDKVFLSELIWREFFMQILWHFPNVVIQNFKAKYNAVIWRNNQKEFKKWCEGKTGYPLVDAGMQELNKTGYMHNRVRMVVAGFLCKHLLIDWRWGEAYFAEKLLDYELASNNGNWQWAAGTGCDSAPYFRIFNPYEQTKKFDKEYTYIKKWIPDFKELNYPKPIVEHKFARKRAIETYKKALSL